MLIVISLLASAALVRGEKIDVKDVQLVGHEMNLAVSSVPSDAPSLVMPRHLKADDIIKSHKTTDLSRYYDGHGTNSKGKGYRSDGGASFQADGLTRTRNKFAGRIAGGETAESGSWPWQAAVYSYDDDEGDFMFWCSATLIASDLIVTSAENCIIDEKLAPFMLISLGTQSLVANSPGRIFVSLLSVTCHEGFSNAIDGSNICLGKLVTNLTFNEYIQSVDLPIQGETVSNEKCVMTGWGQTGTNAYLSGELQQAEIDIFTNEKCTRYYPQYSNDQFCAGRTGTFPCFFDEGNPLVCRKGSNYVLRGITSIVSSDCDATNYKPGLFTDVSKYRNWIDNTDSSFTDESAICYDRQTILSCGSQITQSGTILRSPIVDENEWLYPSNQNCEWTVKGKPGQRIGVEFLCTLSTEATSLSTDDCLNDYLSLISSDKHYTYCGTHFSLNVFNTTSNELTIRFHSDSDELVAKGFVIKISILGNRGEKVVGYGSLIAFMLLATYVNMFAQ